MRSGARPSRNGCCEKAALPLSLAHARFSLQTRSAAREVSPRLSYLAFLRDAGWGWTGAEAVPCYVARQPAVLERSFQVVHRCAHFVAISKPWDTRHDVPRGWPGKARPGRHSSWH